jgi:Flp pilus assembly protein protease CpaA
MAACALWFPEGLGGFLFATSCAGGVLALAAVGVGFGKGKKIAHIPYGLAIGVGAIIELNTKVFAAS